MELKEYREALDGIDGELLRLFIERMKIADEIARWKKEHRVPILDARREEERLRAVAQQTPEELRAYAVALFSEIMELSRRRQSSVVYGEAPDTDAAPARTGQ